jgi:hypothetical protein
MTEFTNDLITTLNPGNASILSLDSTFAENTEGIEWFKFFISEIYKESDRTFNRIKIPFAKSDFLQIGGKRHDNIKITGTVLNGQEKVLYKMHGQPIALVTPDMCLDGMLEITTYPTGRPIKFSVTVYPYNLYEIIGGNVIIKEGNIDRKRPENIYAYAIFGSDVFNYIYEPVSIGESITANADFTELAQDYDYKQVLSTENITAVASFDSNPQDFIYETVSSQESITANANFNSSDENFVYATSYTTETINAIADFDSLEQVYSGELLSISETIYPRIIFSAAVSSYISITKSVSDNIICNALFSYSEDSGIPLSITVGDSIVTHAYFGAQLS